MSNPNLGELCSESSQKDAIHIAVVPVTAGQYLKPGDHIFLGVGGLAYSQDNKTRNGAPLVGIVDPFLRGQIDQGATFWMMLYPGTITGLRHDWYHPSFPKPVAEEDSQAKAISREWLRQFAETIELPLDELLAQCDRASQGNYNSIVLRDDDYEMRERADAQSESMWSHYKIVSGRTNLGAAPSFSCSC